MTGGVKSANRVFDLLELFARRRSPLSAGQVSKDMGWPISSTTALLKSLSDSRYVITSENGKLYFPSVRISDLTRWVEEEVFAYDIDIRSVFSALRDAFGETVTMSVRRGMSMEFVSILLGTNTVVLNVKVGDEFPIFQSAIGTAALSATNDVKIEELWQRALRVQHVTKDQKPALLKRIALCRKQRYVAGFDQAITGLSALTFPLTRPSSNSTYVLAVAGLTGQIREREQEIADRTLAILSPAGGRGAE